MVGKTRTVALVLSSAEAKVLLSTRLPTHQTKEARLLTAPSFPFLASAGGLWEGGPEYSAMEGAGEDGAGGERRVRRDDWTCPNCQAMCFGSKSMCFQCGASHPDLPSLSSQSFGAAAAAPEEWEARGSGARGGSARGGWFGGGAFSGGGASGFLGGGAGGGTSEYNKAKKAEEPKVVAAAPVASSPRKPVAVEGEKRQRGERGGKKVKELKEKAASVLKEAGAANSSVSSVSAARMSLLAGVRMKR